MNVPTPTSTFVSLPVTQNTRAIISEVGAWAMRQPWGENHGEAKHAPDYGIVEETGEAVHCVLKNLQGIRGLDNRDVFDEKFKDALGDAMVYLSHWCFLRNTFYTLPRYSTLPPTATFRSLLCQLLIQESHMLSLELNPENLTPEVAGTIASKIAAALQDMATYFEYDLICDCLVPTWHAVKTRDWHKNRMTGKVDEEPATLPHVRIS